jgi:hypothetical protein
LVVRVPVGKIVGNSEGVLQNAGRFFEPAQADGIIFAENAAFLDEGEGEIHPYRLLGMRRAKVQFPHRLTDFLESLVEIPLAPKNLR